MGFVRKIAAATLGVMLLVSVPASAETPEPLVVTRLADPDPNYVSPAEPKHGRRQAAADEQSLALNAAMQDFSQALGQAILLQQQVIDQRCKSGAANATTGSERMAWEAACKYMRR